MTLVLKHQHVIPHNWLLCLHTDSYVTSMSVEITITKMC